MIYYSNEAHNEEIADYGFGFTKFFRACKIEIFSNNVTINNKGEIELRVGNWFKPHVNFTKLIKTNKSDLENMF